MTRNIWLHCFVPQTDIKQYYIFYMNTISSFVTKPLLAVSGRDLRGGLLACVGLLDGGIPLYPASYAPQIYFLKFLLHIMGSSQMHFMKLSLNYCFVFCPFI